MLEKFEEIGQNFLARGPTLQIKIHNVASKLGPDSLILFSAFLGELEEYLVIGENRPHGS